MKITTGDAHDRLLYLKKQSDHISKGCQDCIDHRPQEFRNYPFYIFAHKRTIEVDERIALFNEDTINWIQDSGVYRRKWWKIEDVPTTRLIWSPRLTKPKPQLNSMCFKNYPPGDNIKVLWILPDMETINQFKKGNMTENQIVVESVDQYLNNFGKLAAVEPDDISEERASKVYEEISRNARLKI